MTDTTIRNASLVFIAAMLLLAGYSLLALQGHVPAVPGSPLYNQIQDVEDRAERDVERGGVAA